MPEPKKGRARQKAVILLSNDLSHPSLSKQQYAFSWRINRLRPLLRQGYAVVIVAAGGRVNRRGLPSISGLKPSIRTDGNTILISPPVIRIPMLWLFQSLFLTPLCVFLYCRARGLQVEAIFAASVPYGAVAKVLNRLLRTVLIVDYGDPDFSRERSLGLAVLLFLERYVLARKGVDAVTCIDPNIGRYMERYGVRATFLPPGGFWKEPPGPEQEKTLKREEEPDGYVVYAGHVAPPPAYRLDLLAEAAPEILKQRPESAITVVGDGAYLPALKKKVRELKLEKRFQFLGSVSYEKAKEKIAGAAVAVQLLNDMCLGTKVVDYFAAGKAVVSCGAWHASYDEFLIDGVNCLLVPPDASKLGEAIIELLSRPDLREALGRKAFDTVSRYDYDSQAKVILGLIAQARSKKAVSL